MGDMKLAEATMRQAKAIANRPVGDPELNARMNEVDGWIAFIHGDAREANELFRQSFQYAVRAFGPHHTKTMDALRGRMYAEQQLKNYDAALALLLQLEGAAAKTPGVDGREFAALAIDRADLLYVAGRHAELLDHAGAALARCEADLGPHHSDCRNLLFRRVRAMLRLGMVTQAAQDIEALEAIASDKKTPVLSAEALFLILKLDAVSGAAERGRLSFQRVQALAETEGGASLNRNYKTKAMLALAEAKLALRDPAGAEKWIQQVLGLQTPVDGPHKATMPDALAKSYLGISYLQSGRSLDALQELQTARDELASLVGATHPTTQFFSLNLAIALEAQGRLNESMDILNRAEPILRESLGADSPTFLRVVQLRRRLQRNLVARSEAEQLPIARQQPIIDLFL